MMDENNVKAIDHFLQEVQEVLIAKLLTASISPTHAKNEITHAALA